MQRLDNVVGTSLVFLGHSVQVQFVVDLMVQETYKFNFKRVASLAVGGGSEMREAKR